MSKKIFTSFLSLLIVASLGGCGEASYHEPVTYAAIDDSSQESIAVESSAAKESSASANSTDDLSAHSGTTAATKSSAATSTPTPKKEEPKVEWQSLTYEWTDDAGYSFRATIKISPWINTKNQDYIDAAWKTVGRDNKLPEAKTSAWGMSSNSQGYTRTDQSQFRFSLTKNITDAYYCIGEISIKNTTSGWDITSDSKVKSDPFYVSAVQMPKKDGEKFGEYNIASRTISQIFYTNTTTIQCTAITINPTYYANKLGPIPFVFAHFENKTPNDPDGEYISEMEDTVFCVSKYWTVIDDASSTVKLEIIE